MSWYKDIEKELESVNDTDIDITIDDIDEKGITFCVYDVEVCEDVLSVIEEVLDFIKKQDNNLFCVTHHNPRITGAECFCFEYRIEVGIDEESSDELYERAKQDREEQAYENYRESKK